MPRPKEDRKPEVMRAIHEHLHLHGPQNWSALMAQFPDVSRPTFFRWIKEAKESIESQASSHGTAALKLAQKRIRSSIETTPERTERQIKAHLPVAPSPAVIADAPGELVSETFDFMAYFNDIVRDAQMVRDSNVTKNEDGTERLKNPVLMDRNLARRISIIQTWLQSIETVYNIEKLQELYHLIIDEVGKVSPEVQQAILVRMRELNNRRGITMAARIR
jgi:hypothetical protein